MKFFVATLVLFVSFAAQAHGWVPGTFKCRTTTYTVTGVSLGDLKVPYMTIEHNGGSEQGFARIVHQNETHSEWLILGNNNIVKFQHGAIAQDWCDLAK